MPISADELRRKLAQQRTAREDIIAANPLVDYIRDRGFELFQRGENFVCAACPVGMHKKPGHRPVSITVAKQVWYCNDHKVGGSVIDWEAISQGVPVSAAMQSLNGQQSAPKEKQFVCAYDYTDENGAVLFRKLRFKVPPPKLKTFGLRRPDGHGGWIYSMDGVRRVLYHLPTILAAQQVIVVEGEKDADNVAAQDFACTTNFDGAGKWLAGYSAVLRGKDVIVMADNDKDGDIHRPLVASQLLGVAKSVRVAKVPEQFKDISDYLESLPESDRRASIQRLIDEAKEFELPAVEVLQSSPLPKIEDAATLISEPIKLPPCVIESVAHRGEKISIGGSSKAFKTWILSDQAISVATGTAWLGYFPTRRGRVLHLNFELLGSYFIQRLRDVAEANQVTIEKDYLHLWNLRGYACDLMLLLPQILDRIKRVEYSLINLDPVYKVLGRKTDENNSGNVADLLNQIELMAVRTGAAVSFGAHYSKGNQSQKNAIDRVSGSGVFARDPDTLINFTEHKEEDCFSVEITLRHHPPVKPFVVKWDYPVFRVQHDLSSFDLKEPGRPAKYNKDDLLELIDEPMPASEIIALAAQELQIPRRRVFEMLVELKKDKRIKQPEKRGKYERI